jgi:glucokinase
LKTALALDIGGTKLAAAIVDMEAMTLLDSAFHVAQTELGADGMVDDLVELASGLSGIERIEGIGVCFGGYAHNNQILKNIHAPGWDNYPLHKRLQSAFGALPVYLANDGNAVAMSEYKYGAGRGARALLFVTVSTGVGGGLVIDGHLLEGSGGIAGEIGHVNAIPEGGPLCNCGRYGCIEAISSGPAMVKTALEAMASDPKLHTALRELPELTARELAEYAERGDTLAVQVMTFGARALGIAVGNAINLLDLDCVVIGGGVSRAGAVWWDALRAAVDVTVLPWRPPVALRPSQLGAHEGLWGAVALLP